MLRRLSGFAIWVILGMAVALAPLACSSDSSSNGDAALPAEMTKG
jgi:hypothetical protein